PMPQSQDGFQRRTGLTGRAPFACRLAPWCDRERSTRVRVVQPPIVDDDIFAVAESKLVQFSQEGLVLCRHPRRIEARADKSDSDGLVGLLRLRRERPRCCGGAEQRYERAASHHSITSSARASSVGGISSPNALAVLRLITSSSF